jgi:hypothetical protein
MRRRFSGDGEPVTLPRARALPESGPGEPVSMAVTVRPSLLDHVTHVNNAAYAALLEDGAFELFAALGSPVERMLELGGALRVRAIDVEYLSDAVAGDRLTVSSWALGGDAPGEHLRLAGAEPPRGARLLQAIARERDGCILLARSEWVWRERPAVLGGVPSA